MIPARRMCVAVPEGLKHAEETEENFSEPELVEQEEEEEAELVTAPAVVVSSETVSFKVGFFSGAATEALVIRRLSVVVGVDANGRHVEPLKTVMEVLTRAFKSELRGAPESEKLGAPTCVAYYTDEEGELVMVRSDQDMGAALCAPAKGGVVRLTLTELPWAPIPCNREAIHAKWDRIMGSQGSSARVLTGWKMKDLRDLEAALDGAAKALGVKF